MWKEFKKFAFKGNVVDLAVAVVIAAAFGQIITALVNNIIMPLVGILIGGVSFESLTLAVGDAVVEYGFFIQALVNFFIIALSIFVFIKLFNHLKRKEEVVELAVEEEEVDAQIELLTEIRDLLKK